MSSSPTSRTRAGSSDLASDLLIDLTTAAVGVLPGHLNSVPSGDQTGTAGAAADVQDSSLPTPASWRTLGVTTSLRTTPLSWHAPRLRPTRGGRVATAGPFELTVALR